jgi:hypothetical protein
VASVIRRHDTPVCLQRISRPHRLRRPCTGPGRRRGGTARCAPSIPAFGRVAAQRLRAGRQSIGRGLRRPFRSVRDARAGRNRPCRSCRGKAGEGGLLNRFRWRLDPRPGEGGCVRAGRTHTRRTDHLRGFGGDAGLRRHRRPASSKPFAIFVCCRRPSSTTRRSPSVYLRASRQRAASMPSPMRPKRSTLPMAARSPHFSRKKGSAGWLTRSPRPSGAQAILPPAATVFMAPRCAERCLA